MWWTVLRQHDECPSQHDLAKGTLVIPVLDSSSIFACRRSSCTPHCGSSSRITGQLDTSCKVTLAFLKSGDKALLATNMVQHALSCKPPFLSEQCTTAPYLSLQELQAMCLTAGLN